MPLPELEDRVREVRDKGSNLHLIMCLVEGACVIGVGYPMLHD
jgi:hypothetical protein